MEAHPRIDYRPNQVCLPVATHQSKKWSYEQKSRLGRSITSSQDGWKKRTAEIIKTTVFEEKYSKAKNRINDLCSNQEYTEALSREVRQSALDTLRSLKQENILPTLINPTGDNSLLFEFFINNDVYAIDFYNSGEIVYLRRRQGHNPSVTEISHEQVNETVSEIARYARPNV